jgi:GTP-binding protein
VRHDRRRMSQPLTMTYVLSAPTVDLLPESRAEVAFVGRSNVGKSSLLNALAGGKLARVSNTPGRTQKLDCFALDHAGRTAVDCPGYGFAKVPKKIQRGFVPMLEDYLLGRASLRMVLLLVDGEIGPTASDLYMLEWMRSQELPCHVVATKHDKVKPSHRHRRQREVAEACALGDDGVTWVSAAKHTGIPALRELVRGWLGIG